MNDKTKSLIALADLLEEKLKSWEDQPYAEERPTLVSNPSTYQHHPSKRFSTSLWVMEAYIKEIKSYMNSPITAKFPSAELVTLESLFDAANKSLERAATLMRQSSTHKSRKPLTNI